MYTFTITLILYKNYKSLFFSYVLSRNINVLPSGSFAVYISTHMHDIVVLYSVIASKQSTVPTYSMYF